VAAVETDQAHLLGAVQALGDLEALQIRLCYHKVSVEDIEEMGRIIGRLRRGLAVERRWLEWVRNGRTIYDGPEGGDGQDVDGADCGSGAV
jgi:hypothetical protein